MELKQLAIIHDVIIVATFNHQDYLLDKEVKKTPLTQPWRRLCR